MVFKFAYKNLIIEVAISSDDKKINVSFRGKSCAHYSLIGGQIQDELQRLLKDQHCTSVTINEDQGQTIFSTSQEHPESALHLLIALRRFMEHPSSASAINFLEEPSHKIADSNDVDSYISKEFYELDTPSNEIIVANQEYRLALGKHKEELNKGINIFKKLFDRYVQAKHLSKIIADFDNELFSLLKEKISLTRTLKTKLAKMIFSYYQRGYNIDVDFSVELTLLFRELFVKPIIGVPITSSKLEEVCYELANHFFKQLIMNIPNDSDKSLSFTEDEELSSKLHNIEEQGLYWLNFGIDADPGERVSIVLKRNLNLITLIIEERYLIFSGLCEPTAYLEIFKKLEQKAVDGLIGFQLLVAKLYLTKNFLCSANIEKSCHFLRMAGLYNGKIKYPQQFLNDVNEEVLQTLLMIDANEGNSTTKYSLGKIYLHRLDTQKAYEYFLQVNPDSEHYNEAMYECANVQFCIDKNKAQALSYFSRLNTKNYDSSIVIEACRNRLGTNPSLTDIYTLQVKKDNNRFFFLSGQSLSQTKQMAHQLFGCTKDNKINLADITNIWDNYLKLNSITTKQISVEIQAVYNKATSLIFNDVGRFQILRDYVLNSKAQDNDFCKLLVAKFGDSFFSKDDCISEPSHTSASSTHKQGCG